MEEAHQLSIRECKEEVEKALNILHRVEDSTNYDVKPLAEAITLLMRLDLDKEFKKYNRGGRK